MTAPFSLAPIQVSTGNQRHYRICFNRLADLPAHLAEVGLRQGRCLIVSDENVAGLYAADLVEHLQAAGWTPKRILVPPGESSKSFAFLQHVLDEALAFGVDRYTPVLALGGGVVGDLAGFAAASLLRGLPLVQIPTTLVAVVDSAVGGKTGINHTTGKNLIGAFHQPALVFTDIHTLFSLPEREWLSGLAEVVKHGLIYDPELFDFLEGNWEAIIRRDAAIVEAMLPPAVQVKVDVVSQDEHEEGIRAILNFGHTLGHALENTAGYGVLTHGEAVAVGMRAALYLSALRRPEFPLHRALGLVNRIPTPDIRGRFKADTLLDAMKTDKKAKSGRPTFVLLHRIGAAYLADDLSPEEIRDAWSFAEEHPPSR